jgi:hypothetical protein
VAKPGQKPRVLLVFGLDPRIQAAGPETVLDDLLTQFAGGYNAAIPDIKPLTEAQLNAIADPEKRRAAILAAAQDPALTVGTAPTFDREKLLEHKPDVVLIFLPGAPPLEPIDQDPRLVDLKGLNIPAVKNNRVVLINDKTALLPGTGLPKVAALMAKAIHPSIAARVDALMGPAAAATKDEKDKKQPEKVEPVQPETKDGEKKDGDKKDADKKDGEQKDSQKPASEKTEPPKNESEKKEPQKNE